MKDYGETTVVDAAGLQHRAQWWRLWNNGPAICGHYEPTFTQPDPGDDAGELCPRCYLEEPEPEKVMPAAANRQAPAAKSAKAKRNAAQLGTVKTILVDQITPDPANERKHYDRKKLKALADSLKTHGQLQNITVRLIDADRYQIVAGERRYRAALIAKLDTLEARVIETDDRGATLARGIENLLSENLNPIEEAAWIETELANGTKPAALAKTLGVTASHISNRRRLLKLPEQFQKHVAAGTVGPTVARDLVPFADRPEIVEAAGLLVFTTDGEFTRDDFRQTIYEAAAANSRPMGAGFDGQRFNNGPAFNVTKKRRADLDVREISHRGETTARAFNVELYDQLQAAAQEKQRGQPAADEPTATPQKNATGSRDAENRDAQPPDAAEVRRAFYRWKRTAVADGIARIKAKDWPAVLVSIGSAVDPLQLQRELQIADSDDHLDPRCPFEADILAALLCKPPKQLRRVAAALLIDPNGAGEALIDALADLLGIANDDWTPDYDFLQLYPDDLLRPLLKQHTGTAAPDEMTPADVRLELLSEWNPKQPPPPEIANLLTKLNIEATNRKGGVPF